MRCLLSATALAITCLAGAASAQSCGGNYTVARGDSLSLIADKMYKNAALWTSIHTLNLKGIGENPNSIRVGQTLELACLNGLPTGLPGGRTALAPDDIAPAAPERAAQEPVVTRAATGLLSAPSLPKVKLVTADDFAPFTQRGLMNDGLLAEVVSAAMTNAVGENGHDTFWINDWSSHLDTMMPGQLVEMAFPWSRPDCDANPTQERCVSFYFSEPMFEYLILLFVDKSRPIPFQTDADLEGRTICRPAGYLNHMLDHKGRNWLSEGKITLVQPNSVSDCFELLSEGKVEAVVMNEFTARDAIKSMGLSDQVAPVQSRPVSITGLHVLIHKDHPQAETLLTTINTGLAGIKSSGQYGEIVSRHMEQIWASF